MFRFFGGIFNLFGVIFLKLTGQTDKARKKMMKDPDVIRATMEEQISVLKNSAREMTSAIAARVAQQSKRQGRLEEKQKELEIKKKVNGAALKAMQVRSATLTAQGLTPDQVKADPEFMRHHAAYSDTKSSSAELETHCVDLARQIADDQRDVDKYTTRLIKMKAEIDAFKVKSADLVARIITAEEDRRINDMATGFSTDVVTARVSEVEDIVREAEAGARVSNIVAGTDAADREAQYLAYADQAAVDGELDALLFGDQKTTVETTEQVVERSSLSE